MKFEGTKDLPSLDFIEDEGIIKIWGRSIANEPKDFWIPLKEKLEVYLKEPRDISISFDLEYFNTPSAKLILDIFKLLREGLKITKRKLMVTWFYDDEELQEAGEDYESMVGFGKWKFIEKDEE